MNRLDLEPIDYVALGFLLVTVPIWGPFYVLGRLYTLVFHE